MPADGRPGEHIMSTPGCHVLGRLRHDGGCYLVLNSLMQLQSSNVYAVHAMHMTDCRLHRGTCQADPHIAQSPAAQSSLAPGHMLDIKPILLFVQHPLTHDVCWLPSGLCPLLHVMICLIASLSMEVCKVCQAVDSVSCGLDTVCC